MTMAWQHGPPPSSPAGKERTSPSLGAEDGKEATPRVAIATATSRVFALAGGAFLAGLIALPLVASRSLLQDLVFILYMLTLAQFWNLLAGYAGLVSVGQQTFVGLGGYLLFALTVMAGLDPLLAILLAGV